MLAEIIQNEQGGVLDAFEELVIRYLAIGTKSRTEVVEKIRYHDEERWLPHLVAIVNDGRCQVGFAAAVIATEY